METSLMCPQYQSRSVVMSSAEASAPIPSTERTWVVLRQDDNGNRFVVRTRLSREEAYRLVAELKARGHKQIYWAEPEEV